MLNPFGEPVNERVFFLKEKSKDNVNVFGIPVLFFIKGTPTTEAVNDGSRTEVFRKV